VPSCAPHRHTTLVGWHRHRQLSAGKGRNHLATSVATNSRWHRPHCFAAVPLELRCCLRFDGSINAFEHARDGPGDPHALALVVLQGCSPGKGPCLCPCPLRRCRAGYCASGTWPYCDSGGGRSVSCRHHRLSQLWAHVRVTRYEVRGRSEDDRPRLWLREVTRACRVPSSQGASKRLARKALDNRALSGRALQTKKPHGAPPSNHHSSAPHTAARARP